jgi:Uma2 family endonuclease
MSLQVERKPTMGETRIPPPFKTKFPPHPLPKQPNLETSFIDLFHNAVALLPTQDDLPDGDGVPMETERHKKQMDLLVDSLEFWLGERGYVGGNMFVYFSPNQLKNEGFKGPDVFVTLGLGNKERKSWVVWEEGKSPDVVIELLSESTAKQDKTVKKEVYQNQLKVAEYFWFDPHNPNDFQGFELLRGVYEELPLTNDSFLSRQLGLKLIRWHGLYRNVKTTWLRWATLNGELLLLPREIEAQRADAETQRADAETQRAEAEAQRADAEAQRAEAEAQHAEKERQQKEQALQKAAQERQRAEAEAQRAEAEAQHAEQERQQKEQALQKAAQERQRAERFAQILRKQGIDPDEFE